MTKYSSWEKEMKLTATINNKILQTSADDMPTIDINKNAGTWYTRTHLKSAIVKQKSAPGNLKVCEESRRKKSGKPPKVRVDRNFFNSHKKPYTRPKLESKSQRSVFDHKSAEINAYFAKQVKESATDIGAVLAEEYVPKSILSPALKKFLKSEELMQLEQSNNGYQASDISVFMERNNANVSASPRKILEPQKDSAAALERPEEFQNLIDFLVRVFSCPTLSKLLQEKIGKPLSQFHWKDYSLLFNLNGGHKGHFDSLQFGPFVISITMAMTPHTRAWMYFTPRNKTFPNFDSFDDAKRHEKDGVKIIPLKLGAIVIMCGDSRFIYNHGIIVESDRENIIPRRLSVTMRYQPYTQKNANEFKDFPNIYKVLWASKFQEEGRDRQREWKKQGFFSHNLRT